MTQAVRYRTGVDAVTGKRLIGFDHVRQSLATIWLTRFETRIMRLSFGSKIRDHLAEDLTPALAIDIYDDLITATHTHEPEYRLMNLRFVELSETGMLGLSYAGVYFPEGRFGNYEIAEFPSTSPLGLARTIDLTSEAA